MPIFAIAVFVSAFLLFSIQPMIAKFLLPAFGGAPGVWAVCLAVFQILLLGGYAYAHGLCRKLSPLRQRWLHLGALAVSLLFLPPVPRIPSELQIVKAPAWEILRVLVGAVGVPFLVLSATAPLLMEWFQRRWPERPANRLYAFSNAGSLLALLSYPFVIEPAFDRNLQAKLWAGGLVLFLGLCGAAAWISFRKGDQASTPSSKPVRATAPIHAPMWLWIALPACGSGLLLALTNQVCQDIAPVPLLWVVPMSVYLLTFILCFESARTYIRGLFIPVCIVALLVLSGFIYYGCMQSFGVQIASYLGILFLGCMVCHGELYRLRPGPERLTAYYLCIAVGGAVGGMFVAFLAPVIFDILLETPVIATLLALLVTYLLYREKITLPWLPKRFPAWPITAVGTAAIVVGSALALSARQRESIYSTRSFYGLYHVKEGPTWMLNYIRFPLAGGTGRVFVSGQVYHGLQFLNPVAAGQATTYYSPEGGLGVAIAALPTTTNRNIGAIGLGVGTLATYGQFGDRIRFYELSPDVDRIARDYFTFLKNSAAQVEVVLGDARVSLEHEPDQHFDLLVLDAFSGDSIPVHLLTDEAMRTYRRHLKPDGVLAVHISNDHLDLQPVVRGLTSHHGLRQVTIPAMPFDPRSGKLGSIWVLASANEVFFNQPGVAKFATDTAKSGSGRKEILWTDDHSSILPILR